MSMNITRPAAPIHQDIPSEPCRSHLTSAIIRGKMPATLGIRLVVGQQTLDLYAVVRIHDPQPEADRDAGMRLYLFKRAWYNPIAISQGVYNK